MSFKVVKRSSFDLEKHSQEEHHVGIADVSSLSPSFSLHR
jgi:hypothetical protein